MSANELFERYSIKEINQRTKISPISLRYIKNKEFDKLPRVKFLGFLKIIENEFKINLDDLREEYENYNNNNRELTKLKEDLKKEKEKQSKNQNNQKKKKKEKKEDSDLKKFLPIYIISIATIGLFIYNLSTKEKDEEEIKFNNMYNEISKESNKTEEIPKNESKIEKITTEETKNNQIKTIEKELESNDKNEPINKTEKENLPINTNINKNINEETNNSEKNISTTKIEFVKVIPNELVWFKAKNLDTNKSIEYLTSNPKILVGANWYIKFGHGNVTIEYGDINITPNTKKITKILLENGNYKYVKRYK